MSDRYWDKPKKKRTGNRKPVERSFLEPDELEYYTRVEKMLDDNSFDDEEERVMFIGNVFKSVDKKEMKIITDRVGSRVLEKLLIASNNFQVRVFLNRLADNYGQLCCDKFGSHVMQTIFRLCLPILHSEIENGVKNPEGCEDFYSMEKLLELFFDEVAVGWTDLMYNAYGSHILRVLFGVLLGSPVDEKMVRSKTSIGFTNAKKTNIKEGHRGYKIPASFAKVFDSLVEELMTKGKFEEAVVDPYAGPVVQTLLSVSKEQKPSLFKAITEHLLRLEPDQTTGGFNVNKNYITEKFICNNLGSRTMETILTLVDEPSFRVLYLELFRNHLLEYSMDNYGNYTVQTLLKTVKDKHIREQMIDEIIEKAEEIMSGGYFGVVEALVNCGVHVKEEYQKRISNCVLNAFHVKESNKFIYTIPVILRLITCEVYLTENGAAEATSQHGSAILQHIFKYRENVISPYVQSMTSFDSDVLLKLCLDKFGSCVVEEFIKSKVDLVKKKKIFKMFNNNLSKLAMDKFGSHVIDSLWANSDIIQKEKIATELIEKENQLKNNNFGKIVIRNCNLESFKRKKGNWIDAQNANMKKKEMFKEILEDTTPAETSIKKEKKSKKDKKEKKKEKDYADPNSIEKNEIDDLFSSKRKHSSSDRSSTTTTTNPKSEKTMNNDDEKENTKRAKKSKKDRNDMIDLKEVIENTKKKSKTKKSKKSKRDTKSSGDDDDKNKKSKKKFMMG